MPGHEHDVAWRRHDDERWIVGDPGRQHEMVPRPAGIAPNRPDTTIDGAAVGDIVYRAVSLRGPSHWEKREPRQDAYLVRISANGQWLVGCVADGVSQGKYSHMAADIACREITRHIVAALDEQPAVTSPDHWRKLADELPWQQAVDQASAAMIAKARTGARDVEHQGSLDAHSVRATMATTAVGFAVATTPTEDGHLPYTVTVAAGDSSALILSGGQWHPITHVKNAGSDMASNAVAALPRDVSVTPVHGGLRPGDALVVITDGIGDPMGGGTGEVGQFLAAHWSRPPDLFAFAAHAAFYRRGFTDDRTAVAVWNPPGTGHATAPAAADEAGQDGDTTAPAAADEAGQDGEPGAGNAAEPAAKADAGDRAAQAPAGDRVAHVPASDPPAQVPAGDSLDVAFNWFGEEGNGEEGDGD